MSTDEYQSPTGIAEDRHAEDRLHDLGVELEVNANGDFVASYEAPSEGVAIVACIDADATVGAVYEAFAAVNQQAILQAGYDRDGEEGDA